MRILHLTPGTGNFHCGACIRDGALVSALRRMGHDAVLAPLYLPMVLDGTDNPASAPLFFGGVNVYLQQKSWLFRHSPRWLDRWLDHPRLLRWAGRRANLTSAADHGALTVSMLRGEDGRQSKELDKLMAWLAHGPRYEVVCLSNALLLGMARRIGREMGAAVVCSLQGEHTFLDALPPPHRERAWQEAAQRAQDIRAFIAPSAYFGELMAQRLKLGKDQLHVAHNGIALDGLTAAASSPQVPTLGYLARLCRDKGLHTLVEAFVLLKQRGRNVGHPGAGLKLRVAGAQTAADLPFVAAMRERLSQAGVAADAEFLPNIDGAAKGEFLRSLSVFSVPATYGEAFGLYVLEALAAGVPVVQPRHGAFPELIEATGGGVLCEPDDPGALASAIEALLLDPPRARALGDAGRRAVAARFSVDHMAQRVEAVYHRVLAPAPGMGQGDPRATR